MLLISFLSESIIISTNISFRPLKFHFAYAILVLFFFEQMQFLFYVALFCAKLIYMFFSSVTVWDRRAPYRF